MPPTILKKSPAPSARVRSPLIVAENRGLRALTLDGKQPTLLNAASGVYPYHKRLFLVTAAKPPPAVARFIAFIRSPAGQKILADNGNWVP